MNAKSAMKMCTNRVEKLINEPEKAGLCLYLKIMRLGFEAFNEKDLTLLKRIEMVSKNCEKSKASVTTVVI